MIAIHPTDLQRLRSQRDLGWLLACVLAFAQLFTLTALYASDRQVRERDVPSIHSVAGE